MELEEVASLNNLSFASNAASYISGTSIEVGGGRNQDISKWKHMGFLSLQTSII